MDDVKAGLDQQDLIGEMTCNLTEIITAPGQKIVKELRLDSKPNLRRGQITVSAEEVQEMNFMATVLIRGEKLDKKDLFGKSDPFIIISRLKVCLSFFETYFFLYPFLFGKSDPFFLFSSIPLSSPVSQGGWNI